MNQPIALRCFVVLAGLSGVASYAAEALPRCPDYVWPTMTTTREERFGEVPVLLAQLGVGLVSPGTTPPNAPNPLIKQLTLPGLESQNESLLLKKNNIFRTPKNAADWSKALPLLKNLPETKQEQALRAAGFLDAENAVSAFDLDVSTKRLLLAKKLVTVHALEKTLDPRIAAALSKKPLSGLSDSELLELAQTPGVRFWVDRTNRIEDFVRKFKANPRPARGPAGGDPTVQIIVHGDGASPGELGGVPTNTAVAIDSYRGMRCVRPATEKDYKYNPSRSSIGRAYDPEAFPDVGLLIWRGKGSERADICSFVRVTTQHILTAGHCVSRTVQSLGLVPRNFESASLEALALLPRFDVKERDPLACFDAPEACGFIVAKPRGRPAMPGSTWPSVDEVPTPDIALLRAVFPGSVRAPSTDVAASGTAPPRLTLAGYGLANGENGGYSGELRVGWQLRPPTLEETTLVWSVEPAGGFAGACKGDSGGAVFSGDVASPKDKRVLAAVVSFGSGGQGLTGVDRCMNMTTGTATRVDSFMPWICEKTANAVKGC